MPGGGADVFEEAGGADDGMQAVADDAGCAEQGVEEQQMSWCRLLPVRWVDDLFAGVCSCRAPQGGRGSGQVPEATAPTASAGQSKEVGVAVLRECDEAAAVRDCIRRAERCPQRKQEFNVECVLAEQMCIGVNDFKQVHVSTSRQ